MKEPFLCLGAIIILTTDSSQVTNLPVIFCTNVLFSNPVECIWDRLSPPMACLVEVLTTRLSRIILCLVVMVLHLLLARWMRWELEHNPGWGWSNQLVVYNSLSNRWEWPKYSGQAPSPRAGHSVSVVGNKAYVFGGEGDTGWMNDLHCLDLVSMRWSLVVPDTVAVDVPVGRFLQTMTPIHTGSTA